MVFYADSNQLGARGYQSSKVATIVGPPSDLPVTLAATGKQPVTYIRSIDTQIVSKHWKGTGRYSIRRQVSMIKNLGATYVAISTPYNRPEEIRLWSDEIHRAGLRVWYRSHWLEWEGDEGYIANLSQADYLTKTSQFIITNKDIFKEGDAFTVCVEPEQMYTARSKKMDWEELNKFIVDQADVADEAFAKIGHKDEIYTNWISVNGYIGLSGLTERTVKRLGLITLDHYPKADQGLLRTEMADRWLQEIDRVHEKWQVPILLGEFGYNVEKEVTSAEQKRAVDLMLEKARTRPYIIGINYWVHMGNSSRIINDILGQPVSYRSAAYSLRAFFVEKSKAI